MNTNIDICTTTLWAELARWRPSAHEVIARPEHWAIHGTTRMGKVLTENEQLGEGELDATGVAAAVRCARGVMDLLARGDGTPARWEEALPGVIGSASDGAAAIASATSVVQRLDASGIELITSVAHALQAGGTLAQGASASEVLAFAASDPRVAERASGPFAALLSLSLDTLYVPVALRSAWDSPACIVASAVELRTDLAALPAILHGVAASPQLAPAQAVVRALSAALERAGASRCVRVRG